VRTPELVGLERISPALLPEDAGLVDTVIVRHHVARYGFIAPYRQREGATLALSVPWNEPPGNPHHKLSMLTPAIVAGWLNRAGLGMFRWYRQAGAEWEIRRLRPDEMSYSGPGTLIALAIPV